MSSRQSLYETLGIEKNADDRAIKKAYFALVRKFPPETHPEEFKRIREAYEVLSNPQSRADYDKINAYDQYGEFGELIKSGQERMEAGDYQTAEKFFRQVVAKQPDLHFVRDMLGMALLNSKRPKEALQEFEHLVSAQPENAVYWLHKGYALYNLERDDQALGCYRKARELDGSDTRVMVAIADVLTGRKQYEAALDELQKAIDQDGEVNFQDFVFFMRRLQIQLLRDRWDLAEKELEQIWKILPDEEDVKKYVATRLSSIAADLFAMKKSADANKLLQWSAKLDSSRKSLAYQFPPKVTLRIADMSASAQAWLEKNAKEWAFGKLQHGKWGGPIALFILALFVDFFVFGGLFGSKAKWPIATAVWMVILSVGGVLFLGWTWDKIRKAKNSPYGSYTTIHPLHLMQVNIDKVTVWPLVNLQDVSLTHHMTNGVYSYTAVRMDFARTICNLTINGQQASVDWANQILAQRRKVLELMSMGLLDAEDGYDIVPPTELADQKKEQTESAKKEAAASKKYYQAWAVAGAALGVIAIPYNRGAAERADWRMCDRYGSLSDCRTYLTNHPSGKHAEQARTKVSKYYDDALASYGSKQQGAKPEAVKVLSDIIEILKTSKSQRILVTYEGSVDFSETKTWDMSKITGRIVPVDAAFTKSANTSRESSITTSLRRAFQGMFSYDTIDIADANSYDYSYSRRGGDKKEYAPVKFVVKYKVGPSGSLYESTTDTSKKMYGILIEWDFAIYLNDSATAAYQFTVSSKPAPNISYSTYSYSDADTYPYTKMAESAFDNFASLLAGSFGISIPGDSGGGYTPPSKYGSSGGGKYGSSSGGYGGKYGSTGGKLDPELQKKLDEILKKNKKY